MADVGEVRDSLWWFRAANAVEAARRANVPESEFLTAVAIALAESRANQSFVGDEDIQSKKWGPSVGMMQLRTLRGAGGSGGPRDIGRVGSDAVENMLAAMEIFRGDGDEPERGWEPWSVFASGEYKKFLPDAERAVALYDEAQRWGVR